MQRTLPATQLGGLLQRPPPLGSHVAEICSGAALSGSSTFIVNIDGYKVSIPTEGAMILFFNKDLPGMIGKAATALGEAGVNISSLVNGRKEKGGEALTVINVDGGAGEAVVKKLSSVEGVKNVRVIQL